jgi:hypothetical protein
LPVILSAAKNRCIPSLATTSLFLKMPKSLTKSGIYNQPREGILPSISRAITIRWISLVPSPMGHSRTSR